MGSYSDDKSALYAMIFLLALAFLAVLILYRGLKRRVRHRRESDREILSRRRISPKMKQYVLERDDYTCQICGISRDYLEELCPGLGDYLLLEIDHIESVANGGSGRDAENLQVLCWRCNRKKGGGLTNEEVMDMIDYGIEHLEEWE